jgi:hypothetical protein
MVSAHPRPARTRRPAPSPRAVAPTLNLPPLAPPSPPKLTIIQGSAGPAVAGPPVAFTLPNGEPAYWWKGETHTRADCISAATGRLNQRGLDLFHAVHPVDHDAHPHLNVRAYKKKGGEFLGLFRLDWFFTTTKKFRRHYARTEGLNQIQVSCGEDEVLATFFADAVEAFERGYLVQFLLTVGDWVEWVRRLLPRLPQETVRGQAGAYADRSREMKTLEGHDTALDHVLATEVPADEGAAGLRIKAKAERRWLTDLRLDRLQPAKFQLVMERLSRLGAQEGTANQYLSTIRTGLREANHRRLPLIRPVEELLEGVTALPPVRFDDTPPPGYVAVHPAQAAPILGCSANHVNWRARRHDITGIPRDQIPKGEPLLSVKPPARCALRTYFVSKELIDQVRRAKGWRAAVPDYIPGSPYGNAFFSMPLLIWVIDEGMAHLPEDLRLCIELIGIIGTRGAEFSGLGMDDFKRERWSAHPNCLGRDGARQRAVGKFRVGRQFFEAGKNLGGDDGDNEPEVAGKPEKPDLPVTDGTGRARGRYHYRTKNGKERALYYGPHVDSILTRLTEISDEKRQAWKGMTGLDWPTLPHGTPLLCTDDGYPAPRLWLTNALGEGLIVAGVDLELCRDLTRLHKLRHNAGSEYMRLFGSHEKVAAYLGITVQEAQETYIHVPESDRMHDDVGVQESAARERQHRQVAAEDLPTELDGHVTGTQAAAFQGDRAGVERGIKAAERSIHRVEEIYKVDPDPAVKPHIEAARRDLAACQAFLDFEANGETP